MSEPGKAVPHEINAAFAIVEEEDRLLLVSEMRRLEGGPRLCWDIPGGGAEPGESLEEAMVREVREETGLVVEPLDLAFMIERFGFRSPDPTRRGRFYFFHARRKSGDLAPSDPQILEAAFKTWEDARRLCAQDYHGEFWRWVEEGRRRRYFLTIRDADGRSRQLGRKGP
jgi:ADP-ribose pyrophosphatase YjhB (NUDIX family)